ncbi:MAG: DUF429 domain-containing protein [Halodesulfurarchaeum sp.]
MSDPWRHVGVDWDSGEWIAVGYPTSGPSEAAVYDSIVELWEERGEAAERIVIDIPIGLCADGSGCVREAGEFSRECDDLARSVLGPRSSSVFTPPSREAVRAGAGGADYGRINEINREQTGKGLMVQAANIAPAILEVEELLLEVGEPTGLLEGHPEVCFRAFADGPLTFGKHTAAGMDERLSALERLADYQRGTWRRLARSLADRGRSTGVDDLLDALALAVTARGSPAELHRLPPDPPRDAEGLPMQMVYRRSEPFDVTGE